MKLLNTLLIILVTLSLNSTAYSSTYSPLDVIQAESQTEPDIDIADDDGCQCLGVLQLFKKTRAHIITALKSLKKA